MKEEGIKGLNTPDGCKNRRPSWTTLLLIAVCKREHKTCLLYSL